MCVCVCVSVCAFARPPACLCQRLSPPGLLLPIPLQVLTMQIVRPLGSLAPGGSQGEARGAGKGTGTSSRPHSAPLPGLSFDDDTADELPDDNSSKARKVAGAKGKRRRGAEARAATEATGERSREEFQSCGIMPRTRRSQVGQQCGRVGWLCPDVSLSFLSQQLVMLANSRPPPSPTVLPLPLNS